MSNLNQNPKNEDSGQMTSRLKWILLMVGLEAFLYSLDIGIVYISLPTLEEEFKISFSTVQWVSLSYLLSITMLLILTGQLGDRLGKKWLYVGGLTIFTSSSLACACSQSIYFLIIARAAQGVGAAIIAALGAAIIIDIFPRSIRGQSLGLISSLDALGIVLGTSLGGILISFWSWRFIFLINVPIGIATILIGVFALPKDKKNNRTYRFDIIGAIALTLSLACFTLGMTFWQSRGITDTETLALLGTAFFALLVFLLYEIFICKQRAIDPILDLSIFQNIEFSFGILANWLVMLTIVGTTFSLPFFLELIEGFSPLKTGVLQASLPIANSLISPVSGRLSDRIGTQVVSLVGIVIMGIACLGISYSHPNFSIVFFGLNLVLFGMGFGMFFPSNRNGVMSAIAAKYTGTASAMFSLSRILGNVVGIALYGTLIVEISGFVFNIQKNSNLLDIPRDVLIGVEHNIFLISALILIASLLFIGAIGFSSQRRSQQGT